MPRQASVPLLRGTFRPVAIWTSRPHAFELHVSHTVSDFAEEDLLLHAVRESDGPADFRPRPAVALWHHMDEILRVMGLRVALVRPEVGAILETGLRDDPAARQVLVRLEAQLEVRLDRLRLLDEPGQSDRTVRVRVSHFDETGFQQVRGLEEAELQPPADDLPEEAGFVERLRLDLVDHDRPVPEEMHDDVGLPEGRRRVAARMRLADAVVRQVALLVHAAPLEEVHGLQEIQLEAASRPWRAEKTSVVDATRFGRVVDDHPVVDEFPGHGARRRPGPR